MDLSLPAGELLYCNVKTKRIICFDTVSTV